MLLFAFVDLVSVYVCKLVALVTKVVMFFLKKQLVVEFLQEKWKIPPLHIRNIRVNAESDLYPECGHGNLQGDAADRLWLQPGIVMAIYYT